MIYVLALNQVNFSPIKDFNYTYVYIDILLGEKEIFHVFHDDIDIKENIFSCKASHLFY